MLEELMKQLKEAQGILGITEDMLNPECSELDAESLKTSFENVKEVYVILSKITGIK